jgi:uncharacterized spore protein YtfJ
MKIDEFISVVSSGLTVTRVFGEPHTSGGVTVIPAAKVMGGGGGGGGNGPSGEDGEGGGFGMFARPTGAYVIKNGEVRWVPALDYNRFVVLGAGLAIAIFRLARRRPRR